MEIYKTGTGQTLKVHDKSQDCLDNHCCIHNPSNHKLKDAPTHWRIDRGLMERMCEHGCGHPDVDAIAFLVRLKGAEHAKWESVHGCCGCC